MRLLILDRDGVINEESDDFIKTADEWIPIPGSVEAIARACNAGYRIVVITNQSGIGRGLLDVDALNSINYRMHHYVADAGGSIEAVFFCPHTAEDNCDCRKPKAGMLMAIAERLGVSLRDVPVIGDRPSDMQAAKTAGARPVLVRTGKFGKMAGDKAASLDNVIVYDNLANAIDELMLEQKQ